MIDAVATSTPTTAATAQKAALAKVAKDFEAVFLRQMIGSMRQATLADGTFDSSASDQFRDMQDSRLADSMAAGGGFGVAQLLLKQFEANPGTAPVAAPAATADVTPAALPL